jgi:preprotein translocase subunit SecE
VHTGPWVLGPDGRDTKEHAVSDERDSADAAGDDVLAGDSDAVVVSRPQRPTGKRSRQRGATALAEPEEAESTAEELGVEEKSGKKARKPAKKKAASGPSRNPFVFVVTYQGRRRTAQGHLAEPQTDGRYTTVVLVFLAFMVALIGLVDLGLAKLVLLVFASPSYKIF